ncbi:MAG: hypothetical protein RLZZ65_57 [Bacteroidota bacterium]|jgi:hypothetical protein
MAKLGRWLFFVLLQLFVVKSALSYTQFYPNDTQVTSLLEDESEDNEGEPCSSIDTEFQDEFFEDFQSFSTQLSEIGAQKSSKIPFLEQTHFQEIYLSSFRPPCKKL